MIEILIRIIETYCFYDCDGLTSIVIPHGVESIGYRAFYNSGKLAAVTIPDTVAYIAGGAFDGCSGSLIFYCSENSYAARYAASEGIAHQTP